MRRGGLVVMMIGAALTGCAGLGDVFSSNAETAARVGTRELEATRLAELMGRLGAGNPNSEAADLLVSVWVDLELLADRVASGGLKVDSLTIAQLIWPQVAQLRVTTWHDSLVAQRSKLRPLSVDSIYDAGRIRLFQHILIRVSGADTAKAKAQAERVLSQAGSGSFSRLAAQYSEDVTKSDSGYLAPGLRGAYVPAFDNAAWKLEPGQMSGVVRSSFGFHIIRRPPVDEIRDRLAGFLGRVWAAQMDSIYMADLTIRSGIQLQVGASAVIRGALTDLNAARNSGKVLVSMRDGSFTVSDLVRWLSVLGPQQLSRLGQANDTALTLYAKSLAQNTVLLREADSAKVTIAPAAYQGLVERYRADIDTLLSVTGLDAPELAESSQAPAEQRHTLAVQKVEDYFDRLTRGQARFHQVPPTLSADLRAAGGYRIFQAGLARARDLVAGKRKDSSAGALPVPPPSVTPADTAKRF